MQTRTSLSVRLLVVVFSGCLLWCGGPALAAGDPVKPNIVLFFVDDLGWSNLGFRNPVYESPNIDRLAGDGLSFEQAYIPTPTCSPSRGALLTGKHPIRLQLVRHIPHGKEHGFDEFGRPSRKLNYWPGDPAKFPCVNWLPLEHVTYAEALGPLGYHNLFIGKWHLGYEPYHPIHQGFNQQVGVGNWGHPRSYYSPYFKQPSAIDDGGDDYLTDKLTDSAVDFIETRRGDKPFMLSLWYYSVHGPHVGRRDLVKRFEARGLTGKEAHYAAMVKAVDESVGRVRGALQDRGLDKNTVVIFLSDQGSMFDNTPLYGGKRLDTLYEGGARVPFFVCWPGVTKPGSTSNTPVQSTDLFPTFVEIAGGDAAGFEQLDGVSLLPVIRSTGTLASRTLYGYRAYEDLYASVRRGDWKLLAWRSGGTKLYNIANDIGESTDVAIDHPEIARELTESLAAWERRMGAEGYSGVQ